MKLSTVLTCLLTVGSPLALAAPVLTPGSIDLATVSERADSIVLPRSPESLPLLRIASPSTNNPRIVKYVPGSLYRLSQWLTGITRNALEALNLQLNLLRVVISLIKVICKLDNIVPLL
ncbi:hypothetical protein QBC41DRAFT_341544 [Cercophora samala]|uniref:Uncharacterized protein n=1 Tax=Cercophora samala TaxID=330535 RepID=A0AA39YTW3_9PEZI|nr:hypothetical protein QBC41DRAFT_341544 [Cercophora samala]